MKPSTSDCSQNLFGRVSYEWFHDIRGAACVVCVRLRVAIMPNGFVLGPFASPQPPQSWLSRFGLGPLGTVQPFLFYVVAMLFCAVAGLMIMRSLVCLHA